MRLRQVALVAHDLTPIVTALEQALGLQVAYRDPAVAEWGLVNAVLPVGGEFLEVVQPVRPDVSAARYLQRRGGDAGYMIILQAEDAQAERRRLQARGIKGVAQADTRQFSFTHFHPADFTGVLASIDSMPGVAAWRARDSEWAYAGPNWRDARSTTHVVGLDSVTIQHPDPEAAAAHWADLLGASRRDGSRGPEVELDHGRICFVAVPEDSALKDGANAGAGIVRLDLIAPDPDGIRARAREHGIALDGDALVIGGVRIALHPA